MLVNKTTRQLLSALVAVLMIGAISYLGVRTYQSSDAATTGGTLTLDPASSTVKAGESFAVAVVANSSTETVNAVQASITYDPAQLQYVSLSEGTAFPTVAATSTDKPGVVRIARGSSSTAVTGSHVVVRITFKMLASSGTAAVGIDRQYSSLVRSSDNTDILQSVTGGSFAVQAANEPASTKTAFSMAPASGSYAIGKTIPVAIRINSPSAITTVQTVVSYPADKLEYVSTTEGGSFMTAQRTKVTPGAVDIIRGVSGGSSGLTGSNPVVTVNFKIIAPGAATLAFAGGTAAYDNSGTGTNILTPGASTGASYTFPTAGGETPPAAPAPTQPVPVTPAPVPGSSAVTTRSGSAIIAVQSGSPASSNGSTRVQGRVDITPVPDMAILQQNPGASIAKVEYFLNDKLEATVTTAPYAYSFDTKKLRNGAYEMRVETHYSSGTVDSNTDQLVVKNPVNMSYVMKHHLLNILLVILVLAGLAFVAFRYLIPTFRRPGSGGGTPFAAGIVTSSQQPGTQSGASSILSTPPVPVQPAAPTVQPSPQQTPSPSPSVFSQPPATSVQSVATPGGPVAVEPTIITPTKPKDPEV